MNNKKVFSFLIITSLLLFVMVGCSEKTNEKIERKIMEETIITEGTGTYGGKFDENHIDILTNGVKKMFMLNEETKAIAETLQIDDVVTYAYQETDNYELILIKLEKQDPEALAKKESEAQEQINRIESNLGFLIQLEKSFVYENSIIKEKNDENYYVAIEELDNESEINPLRWNASSILKEVGTLKELKGDKIPHKMFEESEFVFTTLETNPKMYVAVKRIDNHLLRFTLNIPEGKDEQQLWTMLSTITY